jgi:hypothetical protein
MLATTPGIFEGFKYHRTFMDSENAVLEFSAHIADERLKAVHIISFNSGGEFSDIEKMVRSA